MAGQIAEFQNSGPLLDLLAKGVGQGGVDLVLRTLRKHLGMDVAFISHFRDTDRVFEHVDADGKPPLHVGMTMPLEDGYCQRVVRGELPPLILDASEHPVAKQLPDTVSIPIGSHLSVPITLDDGIVYGTLCAFSYLPDLTLGDRDLKMMRAFAEVLAHKIEENQLSAKAQGNKAREIREAMRMGGPKIVYQPLYTAMDRRLTAVECLSRFESAPERSPDQWFEMAHEVGLGQDLEMMAIKKALTSLDEFPTNVSITVNSSPELITTGKIHAALENIDLGRVVLEITEHAEVPDYKAVTEALKPLRARGIKLAIDDAGAGYASMRHIVNMHPDLIKLDMSLTRDIDTDPNRRALAKAMISFARDIGSHITAEGVETEGELEMLKKLGVDKVQGFYLSRPVSLDEAIRLEEESADAPMPADSWPLFAQSAN